MCSAHSLHNLPRQKGRFFNALIIMAICEHDNHCGFVRYLEQNGLIQGVANKDSSCGKSNPEECPRHKFVESRDLIPVEQVFGPKVMVGETVHTHPGPLSWEEVQISHPSARKNNGVDNVHKKS